MGIIALGGSSPPSRTNLAGGSAPSRRALLGGLALCMLFLGGCANGPSQRVRRAAEAAADGDRSAYAASFTERSRAFIRAYWVVARDARPEMARLGAKGISVSGVRRMAPSDTGRPRASVKVREGDGSMRLVLHRRAGVWRIDLPDTERAAMGLDGPGGGVGWEGAGSP